MFALEAYVDARCRVAKLETWGSLQAELARGLPKREHPELQAAIKKSDELRAKLRDVFLSIHGEPFRLG